MVGELEFFLREVISGIGPTAKLSRTCKKESGHWGNADSLCSLSRGQTMLLKRCAFALLSACFGGGFWEQRD
jgi:hypothetical protein